MSNLKLRIKTDLQDDYSILDPLQLPKPLLGSDGFFRYPMIHTAVARNFNGTKEDLNVFCETGYSTQGSYDILHLFNAGSDDAWSLESTRFENAIPVEKDVYTPGLTSSMVDVVTGGLHIATSLCVGKHEDGTPKFYLFYLNPNHRYRVWQSILLPAQGSKYGRPDQIVQLGLDDQSRVCVYYRMWASSRPTFGYGGKWTPVLPASQALKEIPELAMPDWGGASFTWTIASNYPDPAFQPTSSKLHSGFFSVVSQDAHAPFLWRHTIGADKPVQVSPVSIVDAQIVSPLENSAPLIFALSCEEPRQIMFITNSHYLPGDKDNNAIPLFTDVDSTKTRLGVRAVVSNVSKLNADGTLDVFKIDVLGLFELSDGRYELWHTSNKPQGIQQLSDGVYSVTKDQWTSSFFVTNNILSPNNYKFQGYWRPRFGFENVDNVPTAVVITPDMRFQIFRREAESANWIPSDIGGIPDLNTPPPTMTTSRACVVEITSMLEDGTILPDLRYQLGTESCLNVEIAGKPYVLDRDRSPELQFPPNGRVTIKIANNGELLLPTFWISVEGMQDGEKVDIQAGPRGIHDALRNVGQPGNKALADIVLPDQSHLVPPGQDAGNLDTATKALNAIADTITGDTSPTPDEQRYIYKSTSRHVARSRPLNAKTPILGRMKRENHIGFIFDCSGSQFSFRYLDAHEMADAHASLLGGPMGFFDLFGEIGDFFMGVVNSVVDAVKFVVETVADGVKATIQFVVDGVNKVWNGVIDMASKAADLIVFVFDAIKTAIGKVIDWLKFWFDWDDIRLTARAFKGYMDGIGPTLTDFIDNTLMKITDSGFAYVREHIDSSADAVIAAFGDKTVGSLESSPISVAVPGETVKNPELGTLAGVAIQDILDGLSTAAGYFLDVFSFLFSDGFQQTFSALPDSKKMLDFVESFFASLKAQQVKGDLDQAWDDVKNFVSQFFSKSLFEAVTITKLINAMRSVLKLGVEVMRSLFQGMLQVFKEVSQLASDLFTAPINFPVLSQLYSALMGEQCTMSGVLSLVLSVPCTLLYKAITGKTPYHNKVASENGEVKNPVPGILDSQVAQTLFGIVGIINGLYDASSEESNRRSVSIGDGGAAVQVALSVAVVPPGLFNFLESSKLEEHTVATSDLRTDLQSVSHALTCVRLLIKLAKLIATRWTGTPANKLWYFADSAVSVIVLAGNCIVLGIDLHAPEGLTTSQAELAASGILNSFSSSLNFLRAGGPTPATVVVAVIQAVISTTAGSLQIAAA